MYNTVELTMYSAPTAYLALYWALEIPWWTGQSPYLAGEDKEWMAIPSGGGGGRSYELNQQGEMTLSDCWGWAWLLIWWQERVFWGCETWGEIWSKRRNLPWEDQRVNSPIRGKQTQKLWGSSMHFQPTGSPFLDEMCKQLFSKFMWGGWMGEGWDIASGHLWMPVDVSGASYW